MKQLLAFVIAFPAMALGSNPCEPILTISGVRAGGRSFLHELAMCSGPNSMTEMQVSYGEQPLRTIKIPRAEFNKYKKVVKDGIAELEKEPIKIKACDHKSKVSIQWQEVKSEFSACEGDRRFVLVKKLGDLIKQIYRTP